MKANIVITGLCALLNVKDENARMPEPSMIMPVTNLPHAHDPDKDHREHPPHIPFIAFDTSIVKVDKPDDFTPVRYATKFAFLRLDGKEILIKGLPLKALKVDSTYNAIADIHNYWPAARSQWNSAYVPARGHDPSPSAVAAFMRFGGGDLSSSQPTEVFWAFKDSSGTVTDCRKFSREAIYHIETPAESIVIALRDMSTSCTKQFEFELIAGERIEIWLGNNTANDMAVTLKRGAYLKRRRSTHFAHLHKFSTATDGPIPEPLEKAAASNGDEGRSGGDSTGYCGPVNG